MPDAPCDVCAGHIRAEQPYVRKRRADQYAHAGCAELACFLSEWLHDDTLTYAEAWRRWTRTCRRQEDPKALAKGMALAARAERPISIFAPPTDD